MLRKMLALLRIMWFALVFASLACAGVLLRLRGAPERAHAPAPPEGLLAPLLAASGLVAIVSFVLPAYQYRKGLQSLDLAHEKGGAQGLRLSAATLGRMGVLFQQPFILSLALSESVSFFGLALGVLGYPLSQAGLLLGTGTLLLLLRFPTASSVVGPLEHLRSVRIDLLPP